jgi:catechol 2,3-dioxygenase-like lactoylglutathione lyase family enzyme
VGRLSVGVLGVNHLAFRTRDAARLKAFYRELLAAEELEGTHDPLRAGSVLLVFFESEDASVGAESDELAFDVDAAGFDDALERARSLGCLTREPVEHTPHSRGFLCIDPDGRRIEIVHDDPGVYWR